MATTKKIKGKAKARRKKRTAGKATRKKTGTIRRKVAKKAPHRPTAKKAKSPTTGKPATAGKPTTARKPRPTGARTLEAVKPPPSRPATPISSEQRIGVVTHYYGHLSVAAMQLEPGATLRVGDVIHIWGHTTDFTQRVESLEVNHAPVTEVGPKDDFGLKVTEHTREHDLVFKVRS
jgi:hypothetical protein